MVNQPAGTMVSADSSTGKRAAARIASSGRLVDEIVDELDGLQHRLAVLRFVLRQHEVDVRAGEQRIVVGKGAARQDVERVPAGVIEVAQTGSPFEQREAIADGAGMRDGVVELIAPAVVVVASLVRGMGAAHPLLLEVGDVSQVPDDGTHERAVLPGELGL